MPIAESPELVEGSTAYCILEFRPHTGLCSALIFLMATPIFLIQTPFVLTTT